MKATGNLATGASIDPTEELSSAYQNLVASLLKDYASEGLGKTIDPSASINVAVGVEKGERAPAIVAGISLGLSSFEAAKAAAEAVAPLSEVAPGLLKMGGKSRRRTPCALTPVSSPSPARIVCATTEAHLKLLAPYLASTAPHAVSTTPDLHVKLDMKPLHECCAKMARQFSGQVPIFVQSMFGEGKAAFDEPLVGVTRSLTNETINFLEDLQGIELGIQPLSPTPTKGFLSVTVGSEKAFITKALTQGVEGPAPELFWHLPKDADMASYVPSLTSDEIAPMLDSLGALAEGALTVHDIGRPADRRAIRALLRDVFTKAQTHTVSAQGGVYRAGKPFFGWNVLGFNESSPAAVTWLRDFEKTFNSKSLQASLRGTTSAKPYLPKVKTLKVPKGLGVSASAIEIVFPPELHKEKFTSEVPEHLIVSVVTTASDTWIAWGDNSAEVFAVLTDVADGKPGLGERAASLAPLKESAHKGGSFFTLRGLLKQLSGADLPTPDDAAGLKLLEFASTTAGASSPSAPIFVFSSTTRRGSSATTTITLEASPEATAEIVGLMGRAIQAATPPDAK